MKRIIALLLTMVITVSCCVAASAAETTKPLLISPRPEGSEAEIPKAEEVAAPRHSPWAEQYLSDAQQVYDILVPELLDCDCRESITRAEFCVLLYETISYIREMDAQYNHKKAKPMPAGEEDPFADMSDSRVNALYVAGIVQGVGNGLFSSDAPLTRQEAAAFLARSAAYCGLQTFSWETEFSDEADIASWAAEAVDTVCGMGVMNGMGNGSFAPLGIYTREQAVATAVRLIASYPYMNNRAKVGKDLVFRFNDMNLWLEDGEGQVVMHLPAYWATYNYRTDYGYRGAQFFDHGDTIIMAAEGLDTRGSDSWEGTQLFDVETKELLLTLPLEAGHVYRLTEEDHIVTRDSRYRTNNVDSAYTVWGVYDFTGKVILPLGCTRAELKAAGY